MSYFIQKFWEKFVLSKSQCYGLQRNCSPASFHRCERSLIEGAKIWKWMLLYIYIYIYIYIFMCVCVCVCPGGNILPGFDQKLLDNIQLQFLYLFFAVVSSILIWSSWCQVLYNKLDFVYSIYHQNVWWISWYLILISYINFHSKHC
jgi:hypothetical protein